MQVLAESDGEFEVHPGMPPPELGQDRGQFVEYQVVGRTEPHAPAHGGFGEVVLGRAVAVEDLTGEAEHRTAVGSRFDGVGVAHEQSAARRRLEFRDVLTHRGLAQAQASRGRGETAFPLDGQKAS